MGDKIEVRKTNLKKKNFKNSGKVTHNSHFQTTQLNVLIYNIIQLNT